LPSGLEQLTMAQVTDAHLKAFGRVEQTIVEAVREHSVSIVALTGDIVDNEAGLEVLSEFASNLRATARLWSRS
jgi:predicted MPP superfamily phosphohydrolase